MFAVVLRPVLYAGCALAGVQLANTLRPVGIDTASVAGTAVGGAEDALRQLGKGNLSDAWNALKGGASAAGKDVQASVNAQVKANIILGVVGGCLLAAVVDVIVL